MSTDTLAELLHDWAACRTWTGRDHIGRAYNDIARSAPIAELPCADGVAVLALHDTHAALDNGRGVRPEDIRSLPEVITEDRVRLHRTMSMAELSALAGRALLDETVGRRVAALLDVEAQVNIERRDLDGDAYARIVVDATRRS